jgi:arylsulfatase A-like enzyme
MRAAVLMVNGLQPAYLGAYGCEWVPTPTIDAWAASGVVFDNHFSDAPLVPLTRRMSDSSIQLRASGVKTAFVGPGDSDAGAWDIRLTTRRYPGPIELKSTRRAVRQALEQLGDAPDALLWIEVDALLPPWSVVEELRDEFFPSEPESDEDEDAAEAVALEPWAGDPPERIDVADSETFQRLQRTYAAAVAALDAAIARLRKDCDKAGWGDTVWILTSDAGFPLGEHGAVGPSQAALHEELVHLPLILVWPGGGHAGLRVAELTEPPDVAAALGDLVGRSPAPAGLARLAREEVTTLRSHAICTMKGPRSHSWSVRTREWYLLATDAPETTRRLYVKPDDRWEFNDLAQHHPETVAELEKLYRDAHR